MKKDFLISFMINDLYEDNKVYDILTKLAIKYNVVNLEVSRKTDNENYNYIHARLHNVSDDDIKEIKDYINDKLPNINKGWLN